jgi:hypothetical protein
MTHRGRKCNTSFKVTQLSGRKSRIQSQRCNAVKCESLYHARLLLGFPNALLPVINFDLLGAFYFLLPIPHRPCATQ